MARLARLLALAASVALSMHLVPNARAADGGALAADAGAPAPAIPACIGVQTASRYVPYAYNHVVILTNGCARPATCQVSTDVNPEPRSVEVASSQTVEVTTFMGSPSSTFTAKVGCKLK